MPVITSQRLILQPYTHSDAEAMAALHASAPVMQFMKDSRPLSVTEAAETFARYLACWEEHGFSIFAVRLKSDGAFIGECGFWYRADKPGISMRFLLHDTAWGMGYGWEMNEAATRWLFTETDVMSFWAVTQSRNKGAVSVLRRLGGQITETAHTGIECLLRFDVTKSAWQCAQDDTQD